MVMMRDSYWLKQPTRLQEDQLAAKLYPLHPADVQKLETSSVLEAYSIFIFSTDWKRFREKLVYIVDNIHCINKQDFRRNFMVLDCKQILIVRSFFTIHILNQILNFVIFSK